jgi:hypothetical protein
VREEVGDRVRWLGVGGLDSTGPMAQFVSELGVGGFPHAVDADGTLWLTFEIPVRSSFAFVAADGTISRKLGPSSIGADELRARVLELVDG